MIRFHGAPPWRAAALHGGPGAKGSARAMARAMAEHGGTLEPIQSAPTVDGCVAELAGQLTAHIDKPVALVGHSWGAWLALLTAARRPELAARVVLVGCGAFEERYVPRLAERRRARLSPEAREAFTRAVAVLDGHAPGDRDAAIRDIEALTEAADAYAPLPKEPDPDGLAADGAQFGELWPEAARMRAEGVFLDAAAALKCPLTVVHGEHDPSPVEGVLEPLTARGVAFDAHLLPRCGHTPFRERFAADAFRQLAARWMQGTGK